MFDKMNPVVKAIIMFVIGCVVMLAAQWLAATLRHRTFEIDWIYIIGMGALIAILDFAFPASVRKQNRKNLKDKFTKK